MLKKLITASLLATAALSFTGCQELLDEIILIGNPPANTKVNMTAVINGSQEVPANPSTASGSFTGVYDKATKVLTYTVTYQGLTPTAGHLHRGAPGTNGPVIYPFSSLTPPISGTATFTQADEDLLLNGGFYVNLHTPAYPGGEIRGNIMKK